MSTATINSLAPKAVLDGTEILEISEGGTGTFKTAVSGFSSIFQLLSLKNAANGYAGLNASSLLDVAQIPTAIPAINIADGTVDNTEFQRLNGLSSAIEEQGNKGAVSGYAGLDASQELLLANFPTGTGLQVLRRNTGNSALEFFTLVDAQGIVSINADTTAAQIIAGTASRITVGTVAGTTTIDIDSAYVGQTSITTLGTIVTGVWNGTAITGANINAASTDLTDTAVIVRTNQTNVFGDFIQTFKDNSITIESPNTLTPTTIINAQQTLARNLTIPILTASRSIVVTGEASQITIGTEVTGASTALTDTADIAYLNTANVYIAGTRQDFLGLLAGTAGLNVGAIAGNPTTQVDADLWLNTSTNQLFARINGVNVDLGQSGAEVTTWTANHSMATFKLTASAANDVILLAPTGQGVSIEVNVVQEYLFNATEADYLGNNIRNAGFIESNATNPAAAGAVRLGNTEAVTWRNAANTNNVDITVSAGDIFLFRINGTTQLTQSATALDIQNNNLVVGSGIIQFRTANASIQENATNGLEIDVATGESIFLRANNVTEYEASPTAFILNTNILQFNDVNTTIVQATADLQYDVATGGTHDLRINNALEYEFSATQANFLSNNIVNLGTLNTHTIPGGTSTFALISDNLSVFAATTSLQLAGVISDETGSGALVFGTAPTVDSASLSFAINAQTGTSYTFVLLDAGKVVTSSNAAAVTVTIPPNSSVAYPIGSSLTVISIGVGLTSFAQGAGVTITSTGAVSTAPVLRIQHSSATAIKTATDTWRVVGDIS